MNHFIVNFFSVVIFYLGIGVFMTSCKSDETENKENKKRSKLVAHKTYKCNILYPAPDTLVGLKDSFKVHIESSYPDKKIDSVKIYLEKSLVYNGESLTSFINLKKFNLGGGKKVLKTEAFYNDSIKGISRKVIYLASSFKPKIYTYRVLKEHNHNTSYYTQGLVFNKGFLYESTGGWGKSYIRKLTYPKGEVLLEKKIDNKFFGEGITIFKNRIYQLTYKAQRGFVYDLETMDLIREFTYPGEGWGLTNDSVHLIMSDGTEVIRFLDPETLTEVKRIAVVDDGGPIESINELEYINGEIYANVYLTHKILKINPNTGEVNGIAQMEGLLNPIEIKRADYFNGIAYNSQNGKLVVTGKLWPKLFEVELKESKMNEGI